MDNRHTLLHLSLIAGVGQATLFHVYKKQQELNASLSELYSMSATQVAQTYQVPIKMSEKICAGLADKTVYEQEKELLEKQTISLCTLYDQTYPEPLRHIHVPPPVLFVQGTPLDSYDKLMAVVGSRKTNRYGEKVIARIVPELVAQQWSIVSGGARGADTMAHEQTLKSKGKTIAVFGCGLGHVYPPENRPLFDHIVKQGGTLVSCFPFNTSPDRWLFPIRNRIIAGLSLGCLVVQAAEKSGALITAQYALEQGRQVFAIPGSVEDSLSAGPHKLIQQGAALVNGVSDILIELGHTQPAPEVQQNIVNDPLLALLAIPKSLDELLVESKLDIQQLQSQLFDLQLAGRVRQTVGGLWQAI